ncbi:MAG: rhodanese-like domain-containing protein [Gammaproteobacteria bacterium]|nr:rhodanese-like domain-containing protein [Gammaproteobacteria bacterium]
MDRLLNYFANHPFLAGAAVVLAIAVIAYESRRWGERGLAISPTEAVRLMNDGAVLIDLRGPNQFKDGHIEGARNVPGDQLTASHSGFARFGDRPLILCCDSGAAGAAAARTLARGGHGGRLYALRGGLAAWRQENLPVVRG